MDWRTTSQFLDQLLLDDDEAWGSFLERFRAPLVGFAARLGVPGELTEDIAQESLMAFVKAFRAGRYDRARGRLSSWLFGISYREILRAREKESRRRAESQETTEFWRTIPDDGEAERAWQEIWDREILMLSINKVRGDFAASTFRAFELVALQSQDPSAVAEELGMTRNAVFIAKHRVLTRLRQAREALEKVEA